MTTRKTYLVVAFDVTTLTDEQIGHLGLTAEVQAEYDRDNDFPGVEGTVASYVIDDPIEVEALEREIARHKEG